MECIEIVSYTVPMYGNTHSNPYGRMIVLHEGKQLSVEFGHVDKDGFPYITVGKTRYRFINKGSLYSPKFEFLPQKQTQERKPKKETIRIQVPEGSDIAYNPETREVCITVIKDAPVALKCGIGLPWVDNTPRNSGYDLIRGENGAMTVKARWANNV